MNRSTATEIKKTGATFTPVPLANFLAKQIVSCFAAKTESMTVIDPACGDGALLNAMVERLPKAEAKVIGYDTNSTYLQQAKDTLNSFSETNHVSLRQCDFLSVFSGQTDLFSDTTETAIADIVIANPPYVRTQILGTERARQLARLYKLSGRIDLYYPFIIAMTNALKRGGVLGMITSNRYLLTKSGADVRKFLLENYDILEVIDLGDTKLFDAAVLPAIFIGQKKLSKNAKSAHVGRFRSIYESACQDFCQKVPVADTLFDVLERNVPGTYLVKGRLYDLKSGLLKHSTDKNDVWKMSTEVENDWLETIHHHTTFRVGDRFKVRVGVKSCADNIFIDKRWEQEHFDLEPQLLMPLISQENIDTWHIDLNAMPRVLYPHYSQSGKRKVYDLDRYPIAKRYLEKYRPALEKREYLIKARRQWYEYWVPQNPDLWRLPKVVFPDISLYPRFCFDESGALVNGNCYWMCAQNDEERRLLLLIEGVCNSELMKKYHDICFNNKLYSGRRRYLAQYIEQYPMPDPNSKMAQDIVQVVKAINHSQKDTMQGVLVKQLNDLVNKAFSV